MKPKFNIPLQASRQELQTLIRMYGNRINSSYSEADASITDWIRWNTGRLAELVAMLPDRDK